MAVGARGMSRTGYDTALAATRALAAVDARHMRQLTDRGAAAGARPASRGALVLASAASIVLLWTLSYLLRSPAAGVMDAPGAYARYAVEGMALALVWLGAIATGCAAVLTGLVRVRMLESD